jgi:threonylcarbamoyladenosine tRNA methylthiotransferase MtaB
VPYSVYTKSFGCRTNQEEVFSLNYYFEQQGYKIADNIKNADIVVINSCLVTKEAESKVRRYINFVLRNNQKAKICLTGCMAQFYFWEIAKKLPVTWVVGNILKEKIPEIIYNNKNGIFYKEFDNKEKQAISLINIPHKNGFSKRTRFFLKIQEGCNNNCSYCIVPYVRGRSISLGFKKLKEIFITALQNGYKEIVLTGTHIGQYEDPEYGRLQNILEILSNIQGDFRIRLSSLDPRELNKSFADLIIQSNKICKHIHLSIQSLSSSILEKMNRPIKDFEKFIELLLYIKNKCPSLGLGGDFIVGFPGESEKEFLETCEMVLETGFAFGHIFKFSLRPKTYASKMTNQIKEQEKTKRSEKLRDIIFLSQQKFIKNLFNTEQRILVEKTNPISGLASNYLRINVLDYYIEKNCWLDVIIKDYIQKGDKEAPYILGRVKNQQ